MRRLGLLLTAVVFAQSYTESSASKDLKHLAPFNFTLECKTDQDCQDKRAICKNGDDRLSKEEFAIQAEKMLGNQFMDFCLGLKKCDFGKGNKFKTGMCNDMRYCCVFKKRDCACPRFGRKIGLPPRGCGIDLDATKRTCLWTKPRDEYKEKVMAHLQANPDILAELYPKGEISIGKMQLSEMAKQDKD